MLQIKTFGGLVVLGDDRPLAGAAAQPRRLAILALLARAGERGLTRDKVLAYLWPDADEERARRVLTQAIYALRRDLGTDEAILGVKDLRLNPDVITSDVQAFEAAVAAGRLEDAAALYAGPFLDGFHLAGAAEFERWADEERIHLAHVYAELLEKLARAAGAAGDARAAVGWWRKLASQDPLNAQVAIALMRALVAAGDRNGALQHARVYEALLEQELDAPPDREVVLLARKIRQELDEASAQPMPPPAPAAAAPPAAAIPTDAPSDPDSASAPPAAPATTLPPPAVSPPATVAAADTSVGALMLEAEAAGVTGPLPRPVHEVAVGAAGARAEAVVSTPWWRTTTGLVAGTVVVALAAALVVLLVPPAVRPLPQPGRTMHVAFDPELEVDPALSPDGNVLAYAAGPQGNMRVYVRQLTGGRPIAVAEGVVGNQRWPRWSPDGTQIALGIGASIYVVPALGGAPRILATGTPAEPAGFADWSPDGRQIAFVRGPTIWVRDVAGGPERKLADLFDVHSLRWSPDGKWIAAVSGNKGFITGSATGTSSIGNIAPSAIWIFPSAGGDGIQVTDVTHLNTSPAWTADGRHLVFVSNRHGPRDLYAVALSEHGRPIGEPQRLTTGLDAHTIGITPDGRRLVYSVFTYTANIWSIPIPSGGPVSVSEAVQLTTGNQIVEGLGMSRDGRWLAFDSDRSGNQDIWRMPVEGGEPIQVTRTPWDDFIPSWSPDGREIVFYGFRQGQRRLFVVRSEGGEPRPISTEPGDERHPDWSPDGRQIVFHAQRGGPYQLYIVERTGDSAWSKPRQLTTDNGEVPRWSPDGRYIAYLVYGDPHSLRVVSPDGGESRELVRGDGTPERPFPMLAEWAPDGRTLYYKAFDSAGMASFWAIRPEGGEPRLLVRFDDPSRPTNRPEFVTDGRRFYFTLGKPESDIWTMELVR